MKTKGITLSEFIDYLIKIKQGRENYKITIDYGGSIFEVNNTKDIYIDDKYKNILIT